MKKLTALSLLLLITLASQSTLAKPYKGAEFRTHASFLYGRFETRMRSAAGAGLLASFFTYHDQNVPAEWNEIDIETLGRYLDETQFNIITQGEVSHSLRQPVQFNPHLDFHEMAFEWTPDYVAWFVDGFEIYRETASHVQQLVHSQKLMFNIWPPIYTDWVGTLDPAVLPVYAYYDWVKYYAYTPGQGDNFTLQWEDHFDSFDSGRWGRGTHTWNGNNSDFIVQNAVVQNGYAILCLTPENQIGYNGGPIVDEDLSKPYPVWARAFRDHILIFFSEVLDPTAAENTANFIVPSLTVPAADLQADQRTVRLSVSGMDSTLAYNVITNNILDPAGNNSGLKITTTSVPLVFPLRVNVGGDADGEYLADQIYTARLEYGATGGSAVTNSTTRDFDNTDEDDIFRRERRGITFYQTRVANGSYRVRLMFAETQHSAAGERVFNIHAEGALRENALDIFQRTGDQYRALYLEIPGVAVADGILDIYLEALSGEPTLAGVQLFREPTAVTELPQVPQSFAMSVFPNPFNPQTQVRFQLPGSGTVEIRLFDILGKVVFSHEAEFLPAGTHQRRISGDGLGSGIYFVEVLLDGRRAGIRKAVLVR
ncbi:MAG TPA: family 16 glycosylhydrolase [Calditrichia bacterium]|nr:family 16 glycosylhydrolase [Calditrichota bacterium]HQU73607.1 family 16 glycosylhydrolase [Calditrichia bacterium]HQV32883.1 family 16 glycosylhydrolase [Calditrichia bacterium]